jgi:GMP synthase (glutamine-hydrolysing)
MGSGKKLFVIKAGDTFPDLIRDYGDFEDWIISGLGLDRAMVQVVNVEKGEPLPKPESVRGAVISGSHFMVTQDLDWSLGLEDWTREMVGAGIPLLGICYGHQILARALGGSIDFHPRGIEIGTKEIFCLPVCSQDPLFRDLPGKFKAHLFHSQSVIQLPDSALLLAQNDFEPHQVFRVGEAAWGVQFHPEAFADVTKGYIDNLQEEVEKQGQDLDRLIQELEETPYAASLLEKFARLVFSN